MTPSTTINPVDADDLDPSDDEVSARQSIVQSFVDLSLCPVHDHFLGKSSSLMFLQTAMDVKQEYVGPSEEGQSEGGKEKEKSSLFHTKRPEFWNEQKWVMQCRTSTRPQHNYPDPDLISSLVDYYFEELNLYMPLLHRPTFEQHIRQGLHLRDEKFGNVLLLVCALGARFSDDPRVLLEHIATETGDLNMHSAGWKWFKMVQETRKSFEMAPPVLYDLQTISLAWDFVGIGIRYAQDMGAHRKKVYNAVPSVEEELLKRAFWFVYVPSSYRLQADHVYIRDEDFDVDLPIECDDEYWLNPDPALAFKQPEGKPSFIIFFNCFLRLTQIHAFALRTVYSINKSKALLGFVGSQWEQHIVAEIDSSLNRWIDSVPDHLRWDPHRENLDFLNQSALLYASYYTLQITVHRPFIPTPRKPSVLSFPSLAICTNAARSCIHVLDVQFHRTGKTSYLNQLAIFSSCIVLLLNIWGGKRSGARIDSMKEFAEVQKAMDMERYLEPRWYTAGRVWDVLHDLASVGDLPLPKRDPQISQKRPRNSDESETTSVNVPRASTSTLSDLDTSREVAGSRRVQQYQQQAEVNSSTFTLPMHTDELVLSENFENYFANASGSVGASANATEGFPDTLDNNTLAVWSNAPTGFGFGDWGTYITNFSEMANPDDGETR
ncbi:hypothetical protein EW026_g3256 [Hermanssonia centrifuga]|uniref:Xylanolytic transcriptional activator regulatory domain-containing protein n=1 Tax=Hermanssonia centrifuga TaxID=98765 RepID=A0A4S4KKN9_9APHY|nr:hypothetical protein EW026_g3256 [Hermanssonia centrifuga]